MSEPKVELTVEQKKAAAQQAKADAAAKAKAEKEGKEAKTNQAKLEAETAKVKTVTDAVTVEFNTLQGFVQTGTNTVATLTPESTVEQVNTASDSASESLKSARASLKLIKAQVKKLKEPGDLTAAVTAAEQLVTNLDEVIKSIKGKVTKAKKAAKEAEKAEAKRLKDEAKAANAMPKQNDITRPRPDTACGNAWGLMDELTSKLGQTVPIGILLQAADKKGLNYDTVKTQYARWKKYNGVTGRVGVPLPAGLLD